MQCLQAYVDILLQEILSTASYNEQPLQTLFFGGGTPSLIPPRQLDQILRALDRRFGIAAGTLNTTELAALMVSPCYALQP